MLLWTLSNRHVKHESSILCAELPSAPYDIALLHCDGQSMVLNWKRPVRCGGAEVTDYYIDKFNVAKKEWHEVNVPPVKERLYKVSTHLPPAHRYGYYHSPRCDVCVCVSDCRLQT